MFPTNFYKSIIIIFLLSSCNVVNTTKTLKSSVSELSELYNTDISYEFGYNLLKNKKIRFLKLKVKRSNQIYYYQDDEIPASFIIIYLAKKLDFDTYIVDVYDDNQDEQMVDEYIIDKKYTKIIIDKLKVIERINHLFTEKNYSIIYDLHSKAFKKKSTVSEFENVYANFDRYDGAIKKIKIVGYSVGEHTINKNKTYPFVDYFLFFQREKATQKVRIRIEAPDDKITFIRYNWKQ